MQARGDAYPVTTVWVSLIEAEIERGPLATIPPYACKYGGQKTITPTIVVPAAMAMRAAVSFVAMPPVPHCVPCVLVSAWSFTMSCTCVHKCENCEKCDRCPRHAGV